MWWEEGTSFSRHSTLNVHDVLFKPQRRPKFLSDHLVSCHYSRGHFIHWNKFLGRYVRLLSIVSASDRGGSGRFRAPRSPHAKC